MGAFEIAAKVLDERVKSLQRLSPSAGAKRDQLAPIVRLQDEAAIRRCGIFHLRAHEETVGLSDLPIEGAHALATCAFASETPDPHFGVVKQTLDPFACLHLVRIVSARRIPDGKEDHLPSVA